ncbi:MAG: hypothetical protein ABJN24_06530 [Hyphomicrobiales bacterium]
MFSDNLRLLHASTGHHDRILINAYQITLVGQENDLSAYLGYLAHHCAEHSDEGNHTPSFHEPREDQPPLARAEVSFASRLRSNRAVIGAPLIDGRFVFRRTNAGTVDELQNGSQSAGNPIRGSNLIQLTGHAEIALNPTRAFVHQPYYRRPINGNRGSHPISMYTRVLPAFGGERPINPTDDNVFYHSTHRAALRQQSFESFSNRYIRRALIEVKALLRRAKRDANRADFPVSFGCSTYFNIRQVETYWTLNSAEPIHDLMQVEPRFRALGAESNRRIYANVMNDLETELNVPSLTTRVARGLTAKLYPKTNRSARFEFTRDFHQRSTGDPAHTFEGARAIDGVINLLASCREQAATHARNLGQLLAEDERNDTHHPAYRLVEEIVLAAPNRRIRQLLLELLINNRSYTSIPNDEMRNPIRRLVRRGVVERVVRNGRTVRLTPPYQQAAEILANQQPVTEIATDADFLT